MRGEVEAIPYLFSEFSEGIHSSLIPISQNTEEKIITVQYEDTKDMKEDSVAEKPDENDALAKIIAELK